MPRSVPVREPGRLTRTEAQRAFELPDRMHLPIWEALEPGPERDAAFYAAIVALGRVDDDQESAVAA